LTAIWPDWIELLFDADPDGGNGSAEWGIVIAFAAAAIIFAVLARFEYRRLPVPSKQYWDHCIDAPATTERGMAGAVIKPSNSPRRAPRVGWKGIFISGRQTMTEESEFPTDGADADVSQSTADDPTRPARRQVLKGAATLATAIALGGEASAQNLKKAMA
jgi:hypothetical protein